MYPYVWDYISGVKLYRVIFLTGPPLRMSLDALTAPHYEKVLSIAAERGEILNTLTFLIPRGGGPVWDFNIFWKSVTYWPTLSKFRGGPVKKITLYMYQPLLLKPFMLKK